MTVRPCVPVRNQSAWPYSLAQKKKHDERETAILTMAVVTAMWGSSVNGDACLWVTIV